MELLRLVMQYLFAHSDGRSEASLPASGPLDGQVKQRRLTLNRQVKLELIFASASQV